MTWIERWRGRPKMKQHPDWIAIDTKQVTDIEFEDVDPQDYPDYCDAYISEATYKGRKMTYEELDVLNEYHRDFVYEELWNYLY